MRRVGRVLQAIAKGLGLFYLAFLVVGAIGFAFVMLMVLVFRVTGLDHWEAPAWIVGGAAALMTALRLRAIRQFVRSVGRRSRPSVSPVGWLRSGDPDADEFMRAWWKTWGSLDAGPRSRLSELFEMWKRDRGVTKESASQFLNEIYVAEAADASARARGRVHR